MNSRLKAFIEARKLEYDQISDDRKKALRALAAYVRERRLANQSNKLTFICTHNSRRSQLAQVWAYVAAKHFGVEGVESFSGGTEATAFNPRAIRALQKAGFEIAAEADSPNPRYQVGFSPQEAPLECFSKVYDQAPNPASDFCAVMTCSDADQHCPIVRGATIRLPIQFEDPKIADETPQESVRYDERCAQIAREMLFALASVATRNRSLGCFFPATDVLRERVRPGQQ